MILLHGFGASTFSWREVMASLARLGTVVADYRRDDRCRPGPLAGDWTPSLRSCGVRSSGGVTG